MSSFFFVSGSLLKTRWGNVRDNFRKSLNKQKTKSGQKGKHVKPYKYSEQLKFLETFFEERSTKTNIEVDEDTDDLSPQHDEHGQNCTEEVATDPVTVETQSQNASTSNPTGSINIPKKKTKPTDIPSKTASATLMEYLISKNEIKMSSPPPIQHPVDAFLAGVAPALKKLSPQDWHLAKGEIFATVHRYEYKTIMNPQYFGEGGATSSVCSTPSNSSDQNLNRSTSGDGQLSRSTGDHQENRLLDYSLQDYFHNFPNNN